MASKKTGRNEPCPCGSGRKYKKCCLIKEKPSLPVRPRQHELDDLAIHFIQSHLPSAWTSEEIRKDYGKDLRVEIFDPHPTVGNIATNREFIIQSKGHEKFKIVHTDKIAQQLKVSTLNYLDEGLLPSLLIAYSEEEKKACYLWLKPYMVEVLDKEKSGWRDTAGDSEITIHIPVNNILDEVSFAAIQQHVSDYHNHLLKQRAGSHSLIQASIIKIPPTTPYQLRYPQITNYLPRPYLTEKISRILPKSVFEN